MSSPSLYPYDAVFLRCNPVKNLPETEGTVGYHLFVVLIRELEDKDKSILNLNDYVQTGLSLRDYMLKLWQIASVDHKRQLQNLVFPDGIIWNKETDDIEPLSKKEFLFTWGLKSGSYGEKENGQTVVSDGLSALAPQLGLEPRTP